MFFNCSQKRNNSTKRSRGFTLIELLVVITIISTLVGIVGFYAADARKKGYDASKKADMHELQGAIEMYFSDYSFYPPQENWQDALINGKYLKSTLAGNGNVGDYTYAPSGTPATSYVLSIQLENKKDIGPHIDANGVFSLTQKQ